MNLMLFSMTLAEIIRCRQYRDNEVRFSISLNINNRRMTQNYLKHLKLC